MTASLRRGLSMLALLLLLLGGVLAMQQCADAPKRPRLLDEAQLRALPDDQLEPRILADLTQRLYFEGYSAGAWRRLTGPAAHLYAIGSVEESISGYGFARILEVQDDAGDPHVKDAIAAYAAMGLAAPAKELTAAQAYIDAHRPTPRSEGDPSAAGAAASTLAAATELRDIRQRYQAALALPATAGARLAYIKAHLTELTAP